MIKVENITKVYKTKIKKERSLFRRNVINKKAVDNISFELEKGDICGYIGLNGAGKSTTMKLLSGILKPDNGNILIDGRDPFIERRKNNQIIGAVFGQRNQLWNDLVVRESFKLFKKMYNVSENDYKKRYGYIDSYLNIKEIQDIPVRQLSLGQRMRCEFAASLIHDPKVLYLDEPTIGIDIITKQAITSLIKAFNHEKETTIFFTTHLLDDIEEICNKIIFINNGKIIFNGNIEEFKKTQRYNKKIHFELKEENGFSDILKSDIKGEIEYAEKLPESLESIYISCNEEDVVYNLSLLIDHFNININNIKVENIKLDDIVREIAYG